MLNVLKVKLCSRALVRDVFISAASLETYNRNSDASEA